MEMTQGVTTLRHDGEGFKAMLDSDSWRIAFSNDSPDSRKEAVTKVARHLATEEAFVLLAGEAELYISDAPCPSVFTRIQLKPFTAYVVHRGTWHSMVTSAGTRLFITENASTGAANTEYYPVRLV